MKLYRSVPHVCPYLAGKTMETRFFEAQWVPASFYTTLLSNNFRRSGTTFYQPNCPGCEECRQLRVSVRDFKPSRSQLRSLKKNQDLRIVIETNPRQSELLELYRSYVVNRHGHDSPDDAEITAFLGAESTPGFVMTYLLGTTILGAGWIDQVDDGLSSVYFAFDPTESRRSLGVFSTLKEIELCQTLGLEWLYLGFWVPHSQAMAYKADYGPNQVLRNGVWESSLNSSIL